MQSPPEFSDYDRDPSMVTPIKHSRRSFVASIGLTALMFSFGCMEDNNAEFMKNAAPGPPDAHAGESFAERRIRTRRIPKAQQKAEDKRKLAAEKAATDAAKKSP